MTWNNQRNPKTTPIIPPTREEVITYLKGCAERNLRRPGSNGYTEFGVMMITAVEMLATSTNEAQSSRPSE